MLNYLLELLDNKKLMSNVETALYGLNKLFSNEFLPYSNFEDLGDHYELSIDTRSDVEEDDINIELTDNKVLKVVVEKDDENDYYKSITTETIPSDADADSMSASLKDGKIVVVVEKKNETNGIKINRK